MKKAFTLIFSFLFFAASAQTNSFFYKDDLTITSPLDSVVKEQSKVMKILREFRFQSYLQNEWQRADTSGKPASGPVPSNGIGAFQGGLFPVAANNRFLLRRGRFRFSFEHVNERQLKILDFAFQFDATERGFTIKEFYGRIIDPWIGWISLQGGIFTRPFGYETPAAPAFLESPEFARINQTLMPNEYELGEALVIESPAKFEKVYLRLDATIVNGDGIGVGVQTGAYQSRKDFIGRIKVGRAWAINKSRIGFNASMSYYNGSVLQASNSVYRLSKDSLGAPAYINIADPAQQLKKGFKREYYGAHIEVKADYPIGITTLRGEIIAGTQPGGMLSSQVPLGAGNAPPSADLYLRQFIGGSINFTQSFKNQFKNQVMMHDITVKYDWYDPQARVKGANLIAANGFTQADIKYSTIGIGYSFVPYNFFKLMVWYDLILNENSQIPGWSGDFKKDNVLTIRTQFYVDTWWFNAKSKYKDNLMQKRY